MNRRTRNLLLLGLGAFCLIGVLGVGFLFLGDRLLDRTGDAGPYEAEMAQMCEMIEPGMTEDDIRAVVAGFDNAGATGFGTTSVQLDQLSEDVGFPREDWRCICHVQMTDGTADGVGAPFCLE